VVLLHVPGREPPLTEEQPNRQFILRLQDDMEGDSGG
jgi:hypothetical protein